MRRSAPEELELRLGPFDIFEDGLRRLRREFGVAAIPILLGVATVVVGGASWGVFVADPTNIQTAAKHSDMTSVFHRFVYGALRTVSDFAPSVWNVNEGNHGTDLAAILGAGTFYASVFLIAATLLSETTRKIAARYLYRGHVVIIGETPLASKLRSVRQRQERRCLQIVASGHGRPPHGNAQVRSPIDARLAVRFGLARASCVTIDLGDDMATLSLAHELLAAIAGSGPAEDRSRRADWALVVRDRTLADHFAASLSALPGAVASRLPTIQYVAPERVVVRRFLASRPLFLDEGCRTGIHALVIGSGLAVDELIQAIFLTSLVAGRDWPRVTVVCADPDADRSAFLSRRPGLIDTIDIIFLSYRALDDFEPVARMPALDASVSRWDRRLYDRDMARPVNVVFLMEGGADANARLAIKLLAVRGKTGRLLGNLFGFDATVSDEADHLGSSAFGRTIEGYETFGFDEGFLTDEFGTATRRRTLALALHENYRLTSGDPGVPSWDALPESLRRANGNAADHCLAKLHMLGFDVAGVPSGVIPRLRDADDREVRASLRAEPLDSVTRDVVTLEHDRWALERRFDGWVFGTPRDNARLIHPLLVPWEELSKAEQDKDRDQVEALLTCLRERGDPTCELRRIMAPADQSETGTLAAAPAFPA